MKTRNTWAIVSAMAMIIAGSAQATNYYWDIDGATAGAGGAAPSGTWSSGGTTWSTDSTGATATSAYTTLTTDDLFFSAGTDAVNAYTNGLNSAIQNGRLITFEDGTVTLNDGTLSLGNNGGITISSDTVSGATISSSLTITGIQTFNVAAGRTLTLDTGTFTRNAGATLNVLSTGTVNANMTGLAAGSLVNGIIGPWASFGSGTSTRYATIDGSDNIAGYTTGTTANTEGGWTSSTANYEVTTTTGQTLTASRSANTMRYSGTGLTISLGTGASSLTLNGILATGASGGLTITRGTGGTGTVINGSELVINNTQLVSINAAPISGAGGITKYGTGTVYLGANPAAAHTYLGTTTLNGGITMFGGNLPGGNLTLNGGVFEEYWTSTFSRALGSDAGKVQLIGGASGFSENGGTSMTVKLGNSTATVVWGALGEGAATGFFNPTTFVLESAAAQTGSTLDFQNGINLNGAIRTIASYKTSNLSSGATISGAITGTGASGLIKQGVGHLALTASNTYAGGTTISNGTIRFNTRASMPAAGTVTVANGATLEVTVAGSGTTWGPGTGVAGIAGLTSTSNSGEGFGGQSGAVVNFDGNSFLNLNVTADVTEANDIGNGSATSIRLIKSGANKLTLSGNNSYSGGTFIQQGTLVANSTTALSTAGNITFTGGTLQFTANTLSTSWGSNIKNSSSAITLDSNSQNVTLAGDMNNSNTAGLTKAGTGSIILTGNNTYTGTTTINAGKIVLNNGTVASSAVTFGGSPAAMDILGGSGVNSTWNLNGGDFNTGNNLNIQVLIDGKGTAGSARIIGVNLLTWGKSSVNSTLTLTDGGQMTVNGEIRTGNPYYSSAGGANITIGGGTATSTFSGDGGDDFYIGYGERRGSYGNVVTVSSNGVMTNIRNMFVGHVNNAQNAGAPPSRANRLTVTGTGTASMTSISVGYAQVAYEANENVVQVTNGGKLSTSSGANYIGRTAASGAQSQANSNTVTVTGMGSTWNAGNQPVYVGFPVTGAVSIGNMLTVSTGGVVTNISALTVKAANTLSLGAGGQIYAGTVTNSGIMAVTIDRSQTPACGCLTVTNNLNVNTASLNISATGKPIGVFVIASYKTLTAPGVFAATNGLPDNCTLYMDYLGSKQIAIVGTAKGTLIQIY